VNIYLKAQSWCNDHNIKIYIVPIKNKKECFIEVNDNGLITKSPQTYKNQKIASDKIWDLFLYLYKQNSKHD
jgi:c-di-GMP-related signal transduction protein